METTLSSLWRLNWCSINKKIIHERRRGNTNWMTGRVCCLFGETQNSRRLYQLSNEGWTCARKLRLHQRHFQNNGSRNICLKIHFPFIYSVYLYFTLVSLILKDTYHANVLVSTGPVYMLKSRKSVFFSYCLQWKGELFKIFPLNATLMLLCYEAILYLFRLHSFVPKGTL